MAGLIGISNCSGALKMAQGQSGICTIPILRPDLSFDPAQLQGPGRGARGVRGDGISAQAATAADSGIQKLKVAGRAQPGPASNSGPVRLALLSTRVQLARMRTCQMS